MSALKEYRQFELVIGGRGHSQMIPFGLGVPILSLDVHDKLRFFLEDIDRMHWLLQLHGSVGEISENILNKALKLLQSRDRTKKDIRGLQVYLSEITNRNIEFISKSFYNKE